MGSQSMTSPLRFKSYKPTLRLNNEVILNVLRRKSCVEILLNNAPEDEISELLSGFKYNSIPIVVKNTNLGILPECSNYIFLVSNSSETSYFNFKAYGITKRNNTIILILDYNETWLKDGHTETFGSAQVIAVVKDSVYVLDPPSVIARHFHELTSKNSDADILENIESKHYISGGIVRVATFDCPLFSMTDNTTGHIQGIEAEIVKEMASQLNLTIIIVPLVKSNYSKFGFKLDNGTWVGGVMGALYDHSADLGFCALWVSFDRIENVEQTMPWGRVDLTFLVPRPHQRREHWHTIFLPFHLHTWIAVTITFILATVCHWLLLKTYHFISFGRIVTDFSSVALGMFGALTQCSSMISHGRHSILVFCWYILCVILVALYSSNIVSRLTLPLYTERIDSVKQLVRKGFIWGRPFKSNTGNLLNLQDYWQKKFRDEHFRMLKPEEMHNLIMSGKFAFSVQVLEKYYVFSSDFYHLEDTELINLRVMNDFTNQYMVSIQLVRGSYLYPACNLQIQWLLALGLVDYWKRDVVRRHNRSLMLRLMIDTDQTSLSEPSPLALDSFQGAFLFLFIGLSTAVIAFICEIYNGKYRRTPRIRHLAWADRGHTWNRKKVRFSEKHIYQNCYKTVV